MRGSGALGFLLGAGLGSAVTYIITKKKLTDKFNEDLERIRKNYKKKESKILGEKSKETAENLIEKVSSNNLHEQPESLEDFVKGRNYTNYYKVNKHKKAEKPLSSMKLYDNEADFSNSELPVISYVYDGYLLMDLDGHEIDCNEIEKSIGGIDKAFRNRDVIYVRNEILGVDYEISFKEDGTRYPEIEEIGGDSDESEG